MKFPTKDETPWELSPWRGDAWDGLNSYSRATAWDIQSMNIGETMWFRVPVEKSTDRGAVYCVVRRMRTWGPSSGRFKPPSAP